MPMARRWTTTFILLVSELKCCNRSNGSDLTLLLASQLFYIAIQSQLHVRIADEVNTGLQQNCNIHVLFPPFPANRRVWMTRISPCSLRSINSNQNWATKPRTTKKSSQEWPIPNAPHHLTWNGSHHRLHQRIRPLRGSIMVA